jgi:CHASE2 domain-containing sensor protein
MSHRAFSRVAGLVFLIVAIAHLCRVLLGWTVLVNGWTVPIWMSVVAVVVAGFLAFEAIKRST